MPGKFPNIAFVKTRIACLVVRIDVDIFKKTLRERVLSFRSAPVAAKLHAT